VKLYLGKESNNELVLRDFAELPVLFVVYNDKIQLDNYLENLFFVNQEIQSSLVWSVIRIQSRYQIRNLSGDNEFSHLKELEKCVDKHIRASKEHLNTLLIIDDLFNLKLFNNKKDTNFLIKLLEQGQQHHIYLLIGTSGIFRGLLNSLVDFSNSKLCKNILGSFSELVINEDNLLFFRESGHGSFARYF
jgi:hypothetical protein